jgi:hypothetical protein
MSIIVVRSVKRATLLGISYLVHFIQKCNVNCVSLHWASLNAKNSCKISLQAELGQDLHLCVCDAVFYYTAECLCRWDDRFSIKTMFSFSKFSSGVNAMLTALVPLVVFVLAHQIASSLPSLVKPPASSAANTTAMAVRYLVLLFSLLNGRCYLDLIMTLALFTFPVVVENNPTKKKRGHLPARCWTFWLENQPGIWAVSLACPSRRLLSFSCFRLLHIFIF